MAFPDAQVQILPYNRVVKDLAGAQPGVVPGRAARPSLDVRDGRPRPTRPGEVSMFSAAGGTRSTLPGAGRAPAAPTRSMSRCCSASCWARCLKIGDIRTDKRIDFVGGARGTAELERLVDAGKAAVAFSMFPVTIDDLMAIADAGGIMPPKSTWFEPKLRDGLLMHLI